MASGRKAKSDAETAPAWTRDDWQLTGLTVTIPYYPERFEAGATDFIWMPVWNPEGQRRQLLDALALRDALQPGLSNHLLARIRSLTALSFRSPGFTLSTAAQMVGLSDCRFSRVLLQETGVPFAHYLEHLRVQAAMLMLRNTRVRLSAAAEAAGFSDSELFERSFQRRTGMEARVYRKMLLGK